MVKKVISCIALGNLLVFGLVVNDDYSIYKSNVSNNSCCGYVDPMFIKRPVTHTLVDWTEPMWKKNATKTELWLVSDGLVDGKVQFWTIWDKKPI